LLGKADRTAYIRSPTSDFLSWKDCDFSEMTQLYPCYVNRLLLSKATINRSITHIAHDDTWLSHQAL